MEAGFFYLCLAISLAWLCYFLYLLVLDRQIRSLNRRLSACQKQSEQPL